MICPKKNKECAYADDGQGYKGLRAFDGISKPFCHLKANRSGKPYIFGEEQWDCPEDGS